MQHYPSTTALRCFLAAVTEGSTLKAAEKLRLTQSAVSKQIHALEDLLGGPLFERGARGLKLTNAGEVYRPYAEAALEQLQRGRRRIDDIRQLRRPIRLHILPIIGERWLIARFPEFSAAHPEIDVQFTNYVSETESEEPDLDIRHGGETWPGRVCHYLFGRRVLLVVAPALLERHGPIREPADIQRLSYLQHFLMPSYWAEFTERHGLRGAVPLHTVRYGYTSVVIRAAVAGLGLALAPACFVRDELASGQLVNPLGLDVESEIGYWLTRPAQKPASAEVLAFEDWIRREAAAFSTD